MVPISAHQRNQIDHWAMARHAIYRIGHDLTDDLMPVGVAARIAPQKGLQSAAQIWLRQEICANQKVGSCNDADDPARGIRHW